jgi:GTPase SAR1 family protein
VGAVCKIIDWTNLEKCVSLETRIFESKVDENVHICFLLVDLQPSINSDIDEDQETLNTIIVKALYRRWLEDQSMFTDLRIARAKKKGAPATADRPKGGELFRVSIFGAERAGKTQLLKQVIKGFDPSFFQPAYKSAAMGDFASLYAEFRPSSGAPPSPSAVRLEIWDSSGQQNFFGIRQSYLRGADILLLCFDLCDRSSFSALAERIMPMISSVVYGDLSRLDVTLVGCKLDLAETQRQVSESEARQYALSLGANVDYMECSSKTCHKVHRLFMAAARKHYTRCKDQYSYLRSLSPPRQAKEKDGRCLVC